jgi:MFS family permease
MSNGADEARKGTVVPSQMDAALHSAVRKNAWRLLPILTLAFIINFIDRTSIGFASLTMNKDLGITATEFGFAAGVLFAGYCLFEVPSNLALYRYGARIWLARIMVTWGLVAAATAFVTGPISLYVLRFLLGVFEAGFTPGVTFLLAAWFPHQYRMRILTWFFLAVPVSSVVGGPLSGLLVGIDAAGLRGWQWMFIIEGLPACIVGLALLRILTDRPNDAKWLTPTERLALVTTLEQEPRPGPQRTLLSALWDKRVLLLTMIQFGFVLGSYGIGIWLPQILRQFDLISAEIGFISAVPYVFACGGMLLWGWAATFLGGAVANLVLSCLVSVAGLVFSVTYQSLIPALAGLTISLIGVNSARAIFWTIPPRFLTGRAAAGGMAFINSIGALGGFAGPFLMGWLRATTGSFTTGILVMGGFLLLSSALAGLLWPLMREPKAAH